MALSDLNVHRAALRTGAGQLDAVATALESMRDLIEVNSNLPHLAFGSIGEGARHNYAVSRADELTNLATGIRAARTLADNLHGSGALYLDAEDANVRALAHDRGRLPDAAGNYKPADPADDTPATPPPPIGTTADLVAAPVAAALVGSGALKIAELGIATAADLRACAGMSVLALGTATLWATVVWSDDGSVDNALTTWDQVAKKARALFGSDVATVRKALQTAWHGDAASSADGRILEFVVAGMALADRAERRVAALREMIDELIVIHRLAFVASTTLLAVVVAAIFSVGFAAFAAVYAEWFVWAVAAIDGLLLSWGLIAMWDQSEDGFALKDSDDGTAADAVAVLTPPRSAARRPVNPNLPPPFSFGT